MKICKSCGAEIPDGFSFCNMCGERFVEEQPEPVIEETHGNSSYMKLNQLRVPDKTLRANAAPVDVFDIVFAVGAYLGLPSFLISLYARGNDTKYCRFHCNNALTLYIAEAAVLLPLILSSIASTALSAALISNGYIKLAAIVVIPLTIMFIAFIAFEAVLVVMTLLGTVDALTGKIKPLPFLGKAKLLKDKKGLL